MGVQSNAKTQPTEGPQTQSVTPTRSLELAKESHQRGSTNCVALVTGKGEGVYDVEPGQTSALLSAALKAKKMVHDKMVNASTAYERRTTTHLNLPQNMTPISRLVLGRMKPKKMVQNCAMLAKRAKKHNAMEPMYTSFGMVVFISVQVSV